MNSAKSELKRAESKLKNEGFLKGAPENLVEKEKEKVEKYSHLIDDINNSICSIKEKCNETRNHIWFCLDYGIG